MRLLYLLRHAKSSWDDPATEDFDRPLDARGERAAAAVAVYCRQEGVAPDHIICSPARRTRMTWARIAAEIPTHGEVIFPKTAYSADPATLIGLLRAAPAGVRQAMLVGHNPGLQQLAVLLAADRAARDRLSGKLPSGALVILELDIDDWSDIHSGVGRLRDFVTPKQLV